MPTLYDNFERVRQYIDQHQADVDLSSYATKVELASYVSYAYLESKNYLTEHQDLNSYVTKTDLSNAGYITAVPSEYITQDELSANSYLTEHQSLNTYVLAPTVVSDPTEPYRMFATGLGVNNQWHHFYPLAKTYTEAISLNANAWASVGTVRNYVDGRLAEIEASYVTSSDLPVIDENIIPKETGTYTLGDTDHFYDAAYAAKYRFAYNTYITSISDYGVRMSVAGKERYQWNMYQFTMCDGGFRDVCSLGTNAEPWAYTYTANIYTNTAYLQDTSYTKSIVPAENNAYTLGDTDHFYSNTYTAKLNGPAGGITFRNGNSNSVVLGGGDFRPASNETQNLGRTQTRWNNTYTAHIYTDTAYLQDTSYSSSIVPKETGSYTLGDTDHFYAASYVSDMYLGSDSRFSYRSATQVNLYMNKNWRYVFHTTNFSPALSNVNLGNATRPWKYTYTEGLILNGTDIEDRFNNFIWTGTSAEYAALDNYTSYQIYMIKEA